MIGIVKGNEIAGVRPLVVHAVRENALTRYVRASTKPGKGVLLCHATVKHLHWRDGTCTLNSTPKRLDSTVNEVKDTVEVGTWRRDGGRVSSPLYWCLFNGIDLTVETAMRYEARLRYIARGWLVNYKQGCICDILRRGGWLQQRLQR